MAADMAWIMILLRLLQCYLPSFLHQMPVGRPMQGYFSISHKGIVLFSLLKLRILLLFLLFVIFKEWYFQFICIKSMMNCNEGHFVQLTMRNLHKEIFYNIRVP